MSKDVTPLFIADVSAFSKSLRKSLAAQDTLPGHAAMLALIAKAAGFRNHQHLKATPPAPRWTRWPGCAADRGFDFSAKNRPAPRPP